MSTHERNAIMTLSPNDDDAVDTVRYTSLTAQAARANAKVRRQIGSVNGPSVARFSENHQPVTDSAAPTWPHACVASVAVRRAASLRER